MGPEVSFLKDIRRAEFYTVTDEEALEGNKNATMCQKCQHYGD